MALKAHAFLDLALPALRRKPVKIKPYMITNYGRFKTFKFMLPIPQ